MPQNREEEARAAPHGDPADAPDNDGGLQESYLYEQLVAAAVLFVARYFRTLVRLVTPGRRSYDSLRSELSSPRPTLMRALPFVAVSILLSVGVWSAALRAGEGGDDGTGPFQVVGLSMLGDVEKDPVLILLLAPLPSLILGIAMTALATRVLGAREGEHRVWLQNVHQYAIGRGLVILLALPVFLFAATEAGLDRTPAWVGWAAAGTLLAALGSPVPLLLRAALQAGGGLLALPRRLFFIGSGPVGLFAVLFVALAGPSSLYEQLAPSQAVVTKAGDYLAGSRGNFHSLGEGRATLTWHDVPDESATWNEGRAWVRLDGDTPQALLALRAQERDPSRRAGDCSARPALHTADAYLRFLEEGRADGEPFDWAEAAGAVDRAELEGWADSRREVLDRSGQEFWLPVALVPEPADRWGGVEACERLWEAPLGEEPLLLTPGEPLWVRYRVCLPLVQPVRPHGPPDFELCATTSLAHGTWAGVRYEGLRRAQRARLKSWGRGQQAAGELLSARPADSAGSGLFGKLALFGDMMAARSIESLGGDEAAPPTEPEATGDP